MAHKAWRRRILVLGALLVASLLLLELLLWATGLVPDASEFQFRRVASDVSDDVSGRYLMHSRRFYTTAPGFRHGPTHLGRDATGAWPFRGRSADPAPPDQLRVAVLGDSCVYGAKLNTAHMLGSRIADELGARGLAPDQVAVLSLGVPGYSTVQIDLLLEEALEDLSLDAVVLYPAAWNDQAPALRKPDRELLAELTDPTLMDWLRHHSRAVAAVAHVLQRRPVKEIIAAWEAGEPPLGYRVPADEVGENVRGMIARCREAGVAILVVAPAHPPETRINHPRTEQDALSVLAAAREVGAPAIDAQAVLAVSGSDPGRYFMDNVHPSRFATRILASAIADSLMATLGAALPRTDATAGESGQRGELRVIEISPRSAWVLGDVQVRVSLEGWSAKNDLPGVIIGGAPLLGLKAVGESAVEGTLIANAPGSYKVIVQTSTASTLATDRFTVMEPELELIPGDPPRLRARTRPGDQLRVFASPGLLEVPQWSNRGALWLDPDQRLQLPSDLIADEHGLAEITLGALPTGRLYVQAILAPAETPPGSAVGSRWTHIVQLTLPD
jgi:lysophospholipase L1-like esterase